VKVPNIVIHACNSIICSIQYLLKMCGPQIWLCLFTFRPITSKQLNSRTTIDALSWLGGAVVTHPLSVQEVPGSIPGSFLSLIFLFCCCCVFTFCSKTPYLSQNFAIPFSRFICVVFLTYWQSCDRVYRYKDTDLTSLKWH